MGDIKAQRLKRRLDITIKLYDERVAELEARQGWINNGLASLPLNRWVKVTGWVKKTGDSEWLSSGWEMVNHD